MPVLMGGTADPSGYWEWRRQMEFIYRPRSGDRVFAIFPQPLWQRHLPLWHAPVGGSAEDIMSPAWGCCCFLFSPPPWGPPLPPVGARPWGGEWGEYLAPRHIFHCAI